jgi:penicillin-binding protein 1C
MIFERIKIFVRRNKRSLLRLAIGAICMLVLLAVIDLIIFPLPYDKLHRQPAHFIYSREGKLLNCFSSSDQFWRKPVKLADISPELIRSVITCEDRWFYYHPGINPFSILSAAWTNIKNKKVVRGGSTITMQIARMIEPRERTITSKIIEAFRSFQLELHYSKDELLELYFNLVPYGGNIEGVGAATYFYFEKTPDKLSLSEIAILTALPASPNNYRPDLNPEQCRIRRDKILANLRNKNVISQKEYEHAVEEEIPVNRQDRPFYAPHFCQNMLSYRPELGEYKTTIDFDKQLLCEKLAYMHYLSIRDKSINNLSVVVLDNATGDLLAMIGSPDFNDDRNNGQINGALAFRSPGSSLKPFAYALGMESGLITPSTKLDDIPINYSGYSPENYDEEYHGLVSARDALIQSYNVPAVNVCARVGLQKFYTLLQDGGISSLHRKYFEYGLPLVLGACEVSLLELTDLYSSLAREGEYIPVRFMIDDTISSPKRILAEEASFLISDILSNLRRPDLPASWEFTCDIPTLAWKTGTSYGRKDAWAIGYNPDFTVGVWAGNFSAEGSPYLVGAEISVPLMLDIFHELMTGREIRWFDQPPGVDVRMVCTESGAPPNKDCPSVREAYYIPGVSSSQSCTVHKALMVDHRTGFMLCPACAYGKNIDTVIVENWPPRIADWLLRQGQIAALPEHNPECKGIVLNEAPVIHSPEDNAVYEIRVSAPLDYQKILLQASVSLSSGKIHWFLDKNWFASCLPGKNLFYLPKKGRHELMCMDDFGRSSKILFEVR